MTSLDLLLLLSFQRCFILEGLVGWFTEDVGSQG